MKKLILIILTISFCLALFAQQESHDVAVINIEIPVRVFKESTFVENLTLKDFEVYEDGKLQKIEAVYLVKKTNIERKQEKKKFAPKTTRNFHLFFEISEYTPRLEDAINYFVQNVLVPGDNLIVITPKKAYRMKSETLEVLPKKEIVRQIKNVLRKDAWMGNSEYRDTVVDLADLAKALSVAVTQGQSREANIYFESSNVEYEDMALDDALNQYTARLEKLENLRKVDQDQLLNFSKFLKDQEGQKHVFLFYQKEFIPTIEPRLLNQSISMHQDRPDIIHNLIHIFDLYRRDVSFDVDRVKQAFADSSISIHFLFFTKPAEHIPGIYMEEHSEDIFSAFRETARATGGIADSSGNPEFLFQQAAKASENYYLIYYSPLNYKKDGTFKKIEVKVKNKKYKITHRAGYFAE